MLTRWFKRALAELLTKGEALSPRDLTFKEVKYFPDTLVKGYLALVEIHLGRGITPPMYDNYCLEILEKVITDLDINVAEVDEKIEITVSGSVTYDIEGHVNEIGLVGLFRGSKVLFDRTKVEPTIIVPTGTTIMITYKITF